MFDTTSSKVRKQVFGLLANRWAISCFSVLVFQQVVEASNVFWLVIMMKRITTGQSFLLYLCLYLLSLFLPYIPQCIAYILKISWKQEAQRSFINTFVSSNRNHIGEWSNKGLREQKLSILTSEGPMALHNLIDYIFDLFTYVLSVFLNILALSIIVEPLFSLAYGVSIVFVIVVMKMKRRTQRILTQKALTARIDLCQSLLAAWDNVLLGNEYNFKLWQEKTTQRVNKGFRNNVDLERFDQLLAITVCLMTSIPTLLVILHYIYTHINNVADLSSFLVTLPLLFMILSYTYQTLSLAFRWNMHRSKLNSIYRTIQGDKEAYLPLEKKVKWPKINLTETCFAPINQISLPGPISIKSHTDLLKYVEKPGRLTIRGENGAGKSTLLLLVKNALAEQAFFLPTQNQLSFISETNKYSTGESLKNRLLEILDKVDVKVLLLDEWDANLDAENQEKLTTLIDQLAEKKCVIEVRHR